jgi:hypothetical protein
MKAIVLLLALNIAHANAFSQDKKVAITTFFCDKKIQGTGLGSAVEGLLKDSSFDLKPMLEKAYDRFTNDFAQNFPFKFLDKAILLGNADFQNFNSESFIESGALSTLTNTDYVSIEGLKRAIGADENLVLMKEEKRDPCILLKTLAGTTDGVMLVKLSYEFDSRIMGTAAGIRAIISIALYNKNCDLVFRTREAAASKGKVLKLGGIPIMKPDKIQPLCEDATEELFNDLKGKLPKMLKKIDAKF